MGRRHRACVSDTSPLRMSDGSMADARDPLGIGHRKSDILSGPVYQGTMTMPLSAGSAGRLISASPLVPTLALAVVIDAVTQAMKAPRVPGLVSCKRTTISVIRFSTLSSAAGPAA